jgi:mannose-6-phosphate isomerase-like protein (cupin superfamily)
MFRRLFNLKEILDKIPPQASRTVLFADEFIMASVWSLGPGEEIFPHHHPGSDDLWVVLKGEGEYWLEKDNPPCKIKEGMVALAPALHTHGVRNTGEGPLVFVSVTAPQPLEIEPVKEFPQVGKKEKQNQSLP